MSLVSTNLWPGNLRQTTPAQIHNGYILLSGIGLSQAAQGIDEGKHGWGCIDYRRAFFELAEL